MSALDNDERTIGDALDVFTFGAPTFARSRAIRDYANGRVRFNERTREIYSYGSHFPLVRVLPKGAARRRPLYVLNGDVWRGSASRTRSHQAIARRLCAELGDTVVIPFSALNGARIAIDSIRPVHVRPDTTWSETVTQAPADTPDYRKRSYDYRTQEYSPVAPDDDGMYRWQETHHRLGDCLFSAVRTGETARRRYLSSFDYEEPAPLYFLVQVPRGAGSTVETAIDSLAPRAVWAARARGLEVRRQGDVFFVETALTDDALAQRGIRSRARLTQWDRDAKPRKGETGYIHETAQEKRARVARFHAMRRREYRRLLAEYQTSTSARHVDCYPWRADKRRKVRECRESIARHEDRLSQGDAWTGYAGYTAENAARGLERETVRLAEILQESRAHRRDRAAMCATRLRTWNAADDAYLTDGNRARAAWFRAHELALQKYGAPDMSRPRDYRERVRRALSIYETAHTAREVITVTGGAVYVRGKVSHRPELDSGRPSWDRAPDHRPLDLDPSVWFLAIRNRVPRSRA